MTACGDAPELSAPFLRIGAETLAPVTFGVMADPLESGGNGDARGLEDAFV